MLSLGPPLGAYLRIARYIRASTEERDTNVHMVPPEGLLVLRGECAQEVHEMPDLLLAELAFVEPPNHGTTGNAVSYEIVELAVGMLWSMDREIERVGAQVQPPRWHAALAMTCGAVVRI